MNNNEMMQSEDEISLFDLWEKLREGRQFVLGGACLGGLVAGLALVIITPKYEATSTLQIATIAGKEIEPATTTLERFKSSPFVVEAAKQAGMEAVVEQIGLGDGVVGNYVKAQLVKGTSLLELKTSGDTPESSRKLNDVLILQLERRHEVLGAALTEKLASDVALTKEKLKTVEQELAELSRVSYVNNPKDAQFSPVSLLMSQKIQKQSEMFGLRQQLTNLELMQLPPATQKTQAIEAPFVPAKPVSPKKALLLALGLIGGLLLGVLTVFIRDGWLRAKQARAQAESA